jgi:hypothetical protein
MLLQRLQLLFLSSPGSCERELAHAHTLCGLVRVLLGVLCCASALLLGLAVARVLCVLLRCMYVCIIMKTMVLCPSDSDPDGPDEPDELARP